MEEIIQYGNSNTEIHIWGFPIAAYLFIGGLVAGVLLFISLNYLINRKKYDIRNNASLAGFAFIMLVIGCLLLLIDLRKITNFYQLYLHFDWEAPMSWGAWVLLAVFGLLILWWLPNFERIKWNWIQVPAFKKALSVVSLVFSIILGTYTGILLNVLSARPLWDSMWLPVIFLLSGVSAGLVIVMVKGGNDVSHKKLNKIDLFIMIAEVVFVGLYVLDLFLGTEEQALMAHQLLWGDFAVAFWFLVIFIGLLIPMYFEWKELKGSRVAVPFLVLLGSLSLRYIIVLAGQASYIFY